MERASERARERTENNPTTKVFVEQTDNGIGLLFQMWRQRHKFIDQLYLTVWSALYNTTGSWLGWRAWENVLKSLRWQGVRVTTAVFVGHCSMQAHS